MKQQRFPNSTIACAAIWLAGALLSVSHAQTPSGTEVINFGDIGQLELSDGGAQEGVQQVNSGNAIFFVDELLEINVERTSVETVQTRAGETDYVHTFQVCNLGNGQEPYQLEVNPLGDFEVTNIRIFYEDDEPGFQGTETLYDPDNPPPLSRAGQDGECVDIVVVFDVPLGAPEAGEAVVELRAVSDTVVQNDVRGGRAGLGILEQGTNEPAGSIPDERVDAVIGRQQGEDADFGLVLVSNITLEILKESEVVDVDGGNRVEAGSRITYTLRVQAVGVGTVENPVLRDVIPPFVTYVPNSITVDGESRTDTSLDADGADFNETNLNAITVELNSTTAADPAQVVRFTVEVN